MREIKIRVEPFQFLEFYAITISKKVGCHITAHIQGLISFQLTDELVTHSPVGQQVTIWAQDSNEEKILFRGVVSDISLITELETSTLCLECSSSSILMDMTRYTRAFLSAGIRYGDMMKVIERSGREYSILVPVSSRAHINRMFVQYKETDWQYACRVASRLQTYVVADYVLGTPCISVGIPNKRDVQNIRSKHYKAGKDMERYYQYRPYINNAEHHAIYYTYQSREIYDLCDKVNFNGHDLMIFEIQSRLEGNTMLHIYTMRPEGGFKRPEYFNQNLIGASITGRINEISNDLVQVNLDIDHQSDHRWFQYASPYTSSDGTGWYFMPEVNDAIRLEFASEHDEDSYVISAIHEDPYEMHLNPDNKIIRTRFNKQVIFSPTKIVIDNGEGSRIVLSDSDGILIRSDGAVRLDAGSSMSVSADGQVNISSPVAVYMKKGDSLISIDDNIDIQSAKTRIR